MFHKSLNERRKQTTMQMQSAMLYKKMQKADAHLPTGIRDKSNHNITIFDCESRLTLMGLILAGIEFGEFLIPAKIKKNDHSPN